MEEGQKKGGRKNRERRQRTFKVEAKSISSFQSFPSMSQLKDEGENRIDFLYDG